MILELFDGTQRWILELCVMLIKIIEELEIVQRLLWFPHDISNAIASPLFEISKEYIKGDFM